MTDAPVTASRSALMSRIRSRDTEPEALLRSALWSHGLRYRVAARTPVGRPDIVVPSKKLAVFVDGCFWHGCPEHYVRPRSRPDFWAAKLLENVSRDIRQTLELERQGWRVVRAWECEVHESLLSVVKRVLDPTQNQDGRAWRVFRVDEGASPEEEVRHLRELRGAKPDDLVEQKRHTRKWKRAER